MKVTICTAYYNRKAQFINTLNSICASAIKDIEFIVVDDASMQEERLEDLQEIYPFLKVIRVEPAEKWYVNCCIPFNRAIAEATGEIVVLQNPECMHIGDVLQFIVNNITDENYLAISTYAYNENKKGGFQHMVDHFRDLPQQQYLKDIGWYNHPKYRPVYYHFCAALTLKNMRLLGGFDERYAMGIARDDVEFVDRVGRLGLHKNIPTQVSVLHQWHSKVGHFDERFYGNRLKKNKVLYELLTCRENSIYKENRYAK